MKKFGKGSEKIGKGVKEEAYNESVNALARGGMEEEAYNDSAEALGRGGMEEEAEALPAPGALTFFDGLTLDAKLAESVFQSLSKIDKDTVARALELDSAIKKNKPSQDAVPEKKVLEEMHRKLDDKVEPLKANLSLLSKDAKFYADRLEKAKDALKKRFKEIKEEIADNKRMIDRVNAKLDAEVSKRDRYVEDYDRLNKRLDVLSGGEDGVNKKIAALEKSKELLSGHVGSQDPEIAAHIKELDEEYAYFSSLRGKDANELAGPAASLKIEMFRLTRQIEATDTELDSIENQLTPLNEKDKYLETYLASGYLESEVSSLVNKCSQISQNIVRQQQLITEHYKSNELLAQISQHAGKGFVSEHKLDATNKFIVAVDSELKSLFGLFRGAIELGIAKAGYESGTTARLTQDQEASILSAANDFDRISKLNGLIFNQAREFLCYSHEAAQKAIYKLNAPAPVAAVAVDVTQKGKAQQKGAASPESVAKGKPYTPGANQSLRGAEGMGQKAYQEPASQSKPRGRFK